MDKKFSDYNDDDVIIVLDDELIMEDSICKDIQGSIYIAITPDTNRGFENDPYFKVSWKPINRSNQSVARINMRTGDYISHNGTSVVLDSKIINRVNEMLAGNTYISNKYKGAINGWDALLFAIVEYSQGKLTIEQARKMFPIININPNANTLKNCNKIKWGK